MASPLDGNPGKEWGPYNAGRLAGGGCEESLTMILLMEYHSIFSLDKNEMGCTDATEHVIKLTKSEPFKERFQRITPALIEEVREHIQEMLDGEAIRPSNSPWCNAVMLVRKKEGTLRFCIDF